MDKLRRFEKNPYSETMQGPITGSTDAMDGDFMRDQRDKERYNKFRDTLVARMKELHAGKVPINQVNALLKRFNSYLHFSDKRHNEAQLLKLAARSAGRAKASVKKASKQPRRRRR
jgi:hypothetical protein